MDRRVRDNKMSKQWKWSDGSPICYQSWKSREPQGNSVHMTTNSGQWDDPPEWGTNSQIKGYFCQYHCEL